MMISSGMDQFGDKAFSDGSVLPGTLTPEDFNFNAGTKVVTVFEPGSPLVLTTSWQTVTGYTVEFVDTLGEFNTTSGRFTAQHDGYYMLTLNTKFDYTGAASTYGLQLLGADSGIFYSQIMQTHGTSSLQPYNFAIPINLNASTNPWVEVQANTGVGATGRLHYMHLGIFRLV